MFDKEHLIINLGEDQHITSTTVTSQTTEQQERSDEQYLDASHPAVLVALGTLTVAALAPLFKDRIKRFFS